MKSLRHSEANGERDVIELIIEIVVYATLLFVRKLLKCLSVSPSMPVPTSGTYCFRKRNFPWKRSGKLKHFLECKYRTNGGLNNINIVYFVTMYVNVQSYIYLYLNCVKLL